MPGNGSGTSRPTPYSSLPSVSLVDFSLAFHASQLEPTLIGGMCTNVSPFPDLGSYTAHHPFLDIFATSKSDIVLLRSLYPSSNPQLLLADATAAKVGRMSTSSRSAGL